MKNSLDFTLSFDTICSIQNMPSLKDIEQKPRPSNNSCAFRVHQREPDEDEVLGMNPAFIDLDERKVFIDFC